MSGSNKKIEGEINRFADIFHNYGDDIDENEDADIDFDQFFTNFDKNEDEHETIEVQIEPIKDNENFVATDFMTEEHHLSQKLSQLSASDDQEQLIKKRPSLTPTTPEVTTKKLKTEIVELSNDDMLNYLSSSNKTFEELMNPILQQTATNTITIEDLRQIALLEHKLAFIDLNISLWTTYLRSGTGKLQEEEENEPLQAIISVRRRTLSIWPQDVKSTIMAADRTTNLKANQIDHDTCLNYVYKMLRQFREQNVQYQTQLKQRKQQFNQGFTVEMEEAIKNFVEQYGITLHRIPIEGKIAVVNYDYKDRLIELDFYQENPYEQQIKIFKNLTQSKLDKEISKMEVALLKQRVAHHQLSSLFDSFQIPPPQALDTIQDQVIHQRLTTRYEQLIQRTKSDMMIIYIRTAEAKMEEYTKKFDTDLKQFNDNQRTTHTDEKLTPTMSHLIEQRFININERLKTLYDLKVHFFIKAPTVKN